VSSCCLLTTPCIMLVHFRIFIHLERLYTMMTVVLFRCSIVDVAIEWIFFSFLSVFLSLSFFVSFDYSLVMSVVLLLQFLEKKLYDENREEDEECFPSFALSRSVLLSLGSLPRQKKETTRTIKEKKAKENRDISARARERAL
jgi:hypothetical protein